ncbi:hypothetical protein PAMC26577_32555 [Caballeronia sordidicola]|uniref:Uncharacterized protein n=2 Tax=Caballeronia sordidicola TaxID=196367 RepID=A0A242MBX9_CABSO|nr:hypothetical protein PAMC26577_32555 [Caballeronia sordidicola]
MVREAYAPAGINPLWDKLHSHIGRANSLHLTILNGGRLRLSINLDPQCVGVYRHCRRGTHTCIATVDPNR